jgi:hypothetical protein
MFRPTFLAPLAALPFFFLAPAPAVLPPPPCPNDIAHEPLVLYDVSGGSLGGPIDIALMVYNDGWARITSTGQFGLPSSAELAFPGPAATTQLLLDLSALGAGQLCDRDSLTVDVPVSTLTVFRNATDPRNHTFSWIGADGPYTAVEQRLWDFIHATFPGF